MITRSAQSYQLHPITNHTSVMPGPASLRTLGADGVTSNVDPGGTVHLDLAVTALTASAAAALVLAVVYACCASDDEGTHGKGRGIHICGDDARSVNVVQALVQQYAAARPSDPLSIHAYPRMVDAVNGAAAAAGKPRGGSSVGPTSPLTNGTGSPNAQLVLLCECHETMQARLEITSGGSRSRDGWAAFFALSRRHPGTHRTTKSWPCCAPSLAQRIVAVSGLAA